MNPIAVRIAPVTPSGSQRAMFWFVCMAIFFVFLFQISIPIVIYNQLYTINSQHPNFPKTVSVAGKDVPSLYVVSLHQVVEDYLAVLTCWGGAFLFLLGLMLFGCMKMKTLIVRMHTSPSCVHHGYIDDLKKEKALKKIEEENMMKKKFKLDGIMKMSAETHNPI